MRPVVWIALFVVAVAVGWQLLAPRSGQDDAGTSPTATANEGPQEGPVLAGSPGVAAEEPAPEVPAPVSAPNPAPAPQGLQHVLQGHLVGWEIGEEGPTARSRQV